MKIETVLTVVYLVILLVSVAIDLKKDIIPNKLIVILLLVQITRFLYSNFFTKASHFSFTVTNIFISLLFLLFLFPFYKIGTIGAGDLKLIFLSLLGTKNEIQHIFLIFISGSVLAVFKMVKSHNFSKRFLYFGEYIKKAANSETLSPYYRFAPEDTKNPNNYLHLSISILFAAVISLAMQIYGQ